MNILFIRHCLFNPYPRLSFGMGIVMTILSKAGHNVKAIDNNSFYKYYTDNELLKIIKAYSPDILAFNVAAYNAKMTYELVEKINKKFPSLIILGGGIHMKYCFGEALKRGFDIVIDREGEKIIVPLIEHLEGKTKNNFREGLDSIQGISFIRKDDTVHIPSSYPMVSHLDEVPFVDYTLFNLEDYIKTKKEENLIILNGQRGCPFQCTFCSNPEQRADKRLASAEYTFRSVQYYYNKFGFKSFLLADNNFLISKKRAVEFCHRMIESGLNRKLWFWIQSKLETINDIKLIALLKEAGINRVGIGLERLDPYSSGMTKKRHDTERIYQTFSLLHDQKIDIYAYFIFGFPFETHELLEREKKAFYSIIKHVELTVVNVFQPMHGSTYYKDYPKCREWYLRPGFNSTMKTYFGQVFGLTAIDIIDFDFYGLDKYLRKELKEFIVKAQETSHGKFIANVTFFVRIMLKLDIFLSKISRIIYRISPKLEFWIFRKITFLRYYLGMLLLGSNIGKSRSEKKSYVGLKGGISNI